MKGLIYDIEIIKAVPTTDSRIEGVEYCSSAAPKINRQGWKYLVVEGGRRGRG